VAPRTRQQAIENTGGQTKVLLDDSAPPEKNIELKRAIVKRGVRDSPTWTRKSGIDKGQKIGAKKEKRGRARRDCAREGGKEESKRCAGKTGLSGLLKCAPNMNGDGKGREIKKIYGDRDECRRRKEGCRGSTTRNTN